MIRLISHRKNMLAIAILAITMLAISSAVARTIVVRGGLIQDAVDDANPGDTILVRPGIYTGEPGRDAVVTVNTDNITIRGSRSAVIDATGFEYGIMVGENEPIGVDGCPPITVLNFRIKGLTIKNAEDTGLRLVGVDGFRITHGAYLNNEEYGPFPVCSQNGLIAHNFASGHKDAAIYVGDDDQVVVRHNIVKRSVIGIEIENSSNALVRHNLLTDNTAGILVIVLPDLPMPFTKNVAIKHNWVVNNNFPNPVEPGGGSVGMLATGTGILNVGGDQVSIEKNLIVDNDSLGLGIFGNPFSFTDERIEPFVDENEVRRNVILNNGKNPDPVRALAPGADIVFIPDVIDPETGTTLLVDPDPGDNCFTRNRFDSDFPLGTVGFFPCP